MSLDKKCDRCGEKIGLATPTATVHYRAPLEGSETYEICQGCAAELEAFWAMPGGDFAKEKLQKAKQRAERGDF